MKKIKLLALFAFLFLFLPHSAKAQVPSFDCSKSIQVYTDVTTGNVYSCKITAGVGTWMLAGGGGGAFGPNFVAGGGTAQAQTVAPTTAVTNVTLVNGYQICWLPVAANTGAAPTLAGSGTSTFSAKPITKYGTVALVANDITTVEIACAIYDGTEFQLQVPLAGGVFSAGVSLGSGASAAGATANGGIAEVQAASTGWTPTAGQNYCRADSTVKNYVCSIDGGAEIPQPMFNAVPVGGKCAETTGVAGFLVEAANACAGGGFTTNNTVPKGNGSTLVASSITDDGTTVTTAEPASIQTLRVGLGIGALATNTAVGPNTLNATNTGTGRSTAVGANVLSANTSGSESTGVGYDALQNESTSNRNTAVGAFAMQVITTGAGSSSAFGYSSLPVATAGPNDAFGTNSLNSNTSGTHNVAVGFQSGFTATGANANVSGNNNTWIGYQSGPNTATQLTNSIALGYQTLNSASNQAVIGNASVTDVYAGSISALATTHAAIVQAGVGTQIISGADYTNATTTPSTVFSWTLPATAAAATYRYTCDILWESTAATLVGPVFGVNISAAPTQLTAAAAVQNTLAGADVNGYLSNTTTGSQTLVTSGAAGVTSTNYWAKIWGTIEGAAVAGSTFIINAASTSATTASLNIRRGSGCYLN